MRTLFHGCPIKVEYSEIRVQKYYKDFFWGFYCTVIEEQVARWAVRFGKTGVVNIYSFDDSAELSVKRFPEMSDEWMDVIAACRGGTRPIVMMWWKALWRTTLFLTMSRASWMVRSAGRLSGEMTKFKHPTHRISFHTAKALAALKFERSYDVDGQKK